MALHVLSLFVCGRVHLSTILNRKMPPKVLEIQTTYQSLSIIQKTKTSSPLPPDLLSQSTIPRATFTLERVHVHRYRYQMPL